MKPYPKIFSIGQVYIKDIFTEDVNISEKIDGSQMAWAKIGGQLLMRSKGAMLYKEKPEKMFKEGMDYLISIEDRIPENLIFYTEYLQKPRHNTVKYNRIPKNYFALFGVIDVSDKCYPDIEVYANMLDIDYVPTIYEGPISNAGELFPMLERESVLGGANIEGVVVKNYYRQFLLGGQPMPVMAGKYVSEVFKEVHRERWGKEEKASGRWQTFKESFKTEARWMKALQHLREQGLITNEPKDIGSLVKAVHEDITGEEKENIKEFLWKEYSGEITRTSTAELAEWYKKYLVRGEDR